MTHDTLYTRWKQVYLTNPATTIIRGCSLAGAPPKGEVMVVRGPSSLVSPTKRIYIPLYNVHIWWMEGRGFVAYTYIVGRSD